jgi:hypothetical protein
MSCSLFNIFVSDGGIKVKGPNFVLCYQAICLLSHVSIRQGQTSVVLSYSSTQTYVL